MTTRVVKALGRRRCYHLHDGDLDGGSYMCSGVSERAECDEGSGPWGELWTWGQHLQQDVMHLSCGDMKGTSVLLPGG